MLAVLTTNHIFFSAYPHQLTYSTQLDHLQEKMNEQRKLISDYELKLSIEEKELREAEAWKAAYEKKAGLEDVVRYQKKLKADLRYELESHTASVKGMGQ